MVILTPGFPEIDIDERSGSDKPYVLSETAFTLSPVGLVEEIDRRYRSLGFVNAYDHFEAGDSAVMKNNIETAYKIGPEFALGVYCRELELPNAFSLQQHHFLEDLTSGLEVAVHGLEVLNTQLMDELVAAAENIKLFQREEIPEVREERIRYAMRASALQQKFQEARARSRIFAHYEDYKKGKREDRIALFNFPEYDRVCRATLSPNNMSALSRFAGTIRHSRNYPGERKAFPDDAQTLFDSTKLPIVGYQSFFKKVIEDSLKQFKARRQRIRSNLELRASQQRKLAQAIVSRREKDLIFQGNVPQDILNQEGYCIEELAVVICDGVSTKVDQEYQSNGFRAVDFDMTDLEKMLLAKSPSQVTIPGKLVNLARAQEIDLTGKKVQVYARQTLSTGDPRDKTILELDSTDTCPFVLRTISTYEIPDLAGLVVTHERIDSSLTNLREADANDQRTISSSISALRRSTGSLNRITTGARRFGYSQVDQFGETKNRHIAFSIEGVNGNLYSLDATPNTKGFMRNVRTKTGSENTTRKLSEVESSELWEGTGFPDNYKSALYPLVQQGHKHFIDVEEPLREQKRAEFTASHKNRTPGLVQSTIDQIERVQKIRREAEGREE